MPAWDIVERFSAAKGSLAPSEDRLVVAANGLIIAVDGSTDKSGRDYGGLTGGAMAADCVAATLAAMPPDTAPANAVAGVTNALAKLRTTWGIAANDPLAPSAVAAVVVPQLDLAWRVGDVHVGLRAGGEWRQYPARKAIDDVLAATRAAYLHCLLEAGHDPAELSASDPGRKVILPVLEQQGRLANKQGPYGYGVFDGTPIPAAYIEVFDLGRIEEVVLATDGYISAAATLAEAEEELARSLADDPLRISTHLGTKAVRPGAASFDDRTYIRLLR
ncbi:hypothetical protein [Streptomyces sp. 4N509B]|uniref:hypothetical protein n=1 Tax=Streptomyces sp. 4N509B TaxID=3457413 RepID=UPI003FD1457C